MEKTHKPIKLGYCAEGNALTKNGQQFWRVLVCKNSTTYRPGTDLCKDEVDELCASRLWDVTIVTLKTESA